MTYNMSEKNVNSKQIQNQNEKDYLSNIIEIRLNRRKICQIFCLYFFILSIVYLIFGVLFFYATYVTRYFIIDPDKFWSINMKRPGLLKLQRFCAAEGMFLVCSSLFSIMDNIVIYLHIIKGGLKRRLKYANIIFFFLQIISFIFNLYGFCSYKSIIILFPLLFSYSSLILFLSILYFIFIKRSIKVENLFLLSIKRMTLNKKNMNINYKKDLANK